MTRIALAVVALVACKQDERAPVDPIEVRVPPAVPVDARAADAAIDAAIDAPTLDAGVAMGRLGGTVTFTDRAGHPVTSPVPRCRVVATDDSGAVASAITDAAGRYQLTLAPGRFKLSFADCKRGCEPEPYVAATVTSGTSTKLDWGSASCTKCLDASAMVDTPTGPRAIAELRVGMAIWVVDPIGRRVAAHIVATQRLALDPGARVDRVVLDDGRAVTASGPHPLADGRTIGALRPGDAVDGARVVRVDHVPYRDGHSYDVLPSIEGAYLVDGVPMASTMAR